MSHELPIKWMPNVCSCVIMQSRTEPENYYQFIHKCEVHQNMNDEEARASVIQMCIDAQQGE
jgi:hypothetical protein